MVEALPDDECRRLVRHLVLLALADARLGGTELERVEEFLFGMDAFGMGAQILPDVTTRPGDFHVPSFVAAYAQGEPLAVDLRFWDPWPSVARPLGDVQRELGLRAPRSPRSSTDHAPPASSPRG